MKCNRSRLCGIKVTAVSPVMFPAGSGRVCFALVANHNTLFTGQSHFTFYSSHKQHTFHCPITYYCFHFHKNIIVFILYTKCCACVLLSTMNFFGIFLASSKPPRLILTSLSHCGYHRYYNHYGLSHWCALVAAVKEGPLT